MNGQDEVICVDKTQFTLICQSKGVHHKWTVTCQPKALYFAISVAEIKVSYQSDLISANWINQEKVNCFSKDFMFFIMIFFAFLSVESSGAVNLFSSNYFVRYMEWQKLSSIVHSNMKGIYYELSMHVHFDNTHQIPLVFQYLHTTYSKPSM